ncbi:MAG: hypothetical protein EA396_08005 [Anaerolineaceae bacterium]|nr:MAG: hypothetical protein EA396_08005 [Anaerolineaceae bacterium]
MKETRALIERIIEVNSAIQHLHLSFEGSPGRIKPGLSLLVGVADIAHPYLRESWWPVSIKDDFIVVERPAKERYEIGQVVNALGYIGKPYLFRRNLRNVLLVAHDTPPTPLLLTIPWLLGNKISVTLVLTGTARTYNTEHLDRRVEIIRGDEGFTWPDQVMNAGWADQVFVTTGGADENAAFRMVYDHFETLRASVQPNYLFGVFRPILPCGVGACGACWLASKRGAAMICTDGPAFDLTQMVR